jgi:hypothetical protein
VRRLIPQPVFPAIGNITCRVDRDIRWFGYIFLALSFTDGDVSVAVANGVRVIAVSKKMRESRMRLISLRVQKSHGIW